MRIDWQELVARMLSGHIVEYERQKRRPDQAPRSISWTLTSKRRTRASRRTDRSSFHYFSAQWNVSEKAGPYCVTAYCTSFTTVVPLLGTFPVSMRSAP